MSGHSKWSTIKHKKGALDAKRGKLFSQLSKNIRISVKEGKSGDPKSNPSLRLAMEKARAANMSNDNIKRAVERGLGKGKSGRIEEIIYEGFGPQGVGILVLALTDNKQRTGADVRNIFSKHGGSLGSPGSVMYMFQRSQDGSEYTATITMPLGSEAEQQQIKGLVDNLRQNEDVEDVYCNVKCE